MDAIIPISHKFHSTITRKLQQCTDLKEELMRIWHMYMGCIILRGVLLKLASLNIKVKHAVSGTLGISTTHSGYYSEQITQKFKAAYSPPCCMYSKAESNNT